LNLKLISINLIADDCRNLTKILQKLASEGHVFHKSGFSLPTKVTTAQEQEKEK
jgi:hypothetical protein